MYGGRERKLVIPPVQREIRVCGRTSSSLKVLRSGPIKIGQSGMIDLLWCHFVDCCRIAHYQHTWNTRNEKPAVMNQEQYRRLAAHAKAQDAVLMGAKVGT